MQCTTLQSTLRLSVVVVLFVAISSFTTAQTIHYVKPVASGTGDGSSWLNASADLQAMLNAASAGDEIWVAAGTYKPTLDPFGSASPTDPRDKTFFIKDGTKLYGNFAGTETNIFQRDLTANPTILSGDLNGDDVTGLDANGLPQYTNTEENTYHVVLASGNTGVLINGLQVTAGNAADGTGSISVNGNNILRDAGAGLYLAGGNASASVTNLLINNNQAGLNGGAGIYSAINAFLLTHSILGLNQATNGGALYLASGNNNFVENNVLAGNIANNNGSAIYAGSGIHSLYNNTLYSNVTLIGNGALYLQGATSSVFAFNNIFWDNLKVTGFIPSVTVSNAVAGTDYFNNGSTNLALRYNLLQLASSNYTTTGGGGNYDLGATASNNLFGTDPQFVNAPSADFRLSAGSPAINVGDNGASTVPVDILGNTRIHDGTIDLGVAEYGSTPLPVEWLAFTGEANGTAHLLQWATATETNNQGFWVEASQVGRDFVPIGWVAGQGSTLTRTDYTYRVAAPKAGVTYYRLQQVDEDGTHAYSPVIALVQRVTAPQLRAYPLPMREVLTLDHAQGLATLFNAIGQPVQQVRITNATHQFDVQHLPQGHYTLHLLRDDGSVHTQQLIK